MRFRENDFFLQSFIVKHPNKQTVTEVRWDKRPQIAQCFQHHCGIISSGFIFIRSILLEVVHKIHTSSFCSNRSRLLHFSSVLSLQFASIYFNTWCQGCLPRRNCAYSIVYLQSIFCDITHGAIAVLSIRVSVACVQTLHRKSKRRRKVESAQLSHCSCSRVPPN